MVGAVMVTAVEAVVECMSKRLGGSVQWLGKVFCGDSDLYLGNFNGNSRLMWSLE